MWRAGLSGGWGYVGVGAAVGLTGWAGETYPQGLRRRAGQEALALGTPEPFWADHAAHGLRRTRPEFSAAAPLALWQRSFPLFIAALVTALLAVSPQTLWDAVLVAFAIPFLLVVLLRLSALVHLVQVSPPGSPREAPANATTDDSLPPYSLLIALHREVEVAPALVRAMAALDYPADKHEILFVTEAEDSATRAALRASGLASNMRIITVPDGNPRTKPRALNYALSLARGALIAVYDAEDVPEPDQLRKAAAAFAASIEPLACVQARLNVYNGGVNAITRQFALEYSALYDATLPALHRLGLPLPLGGTSNHFARAALEDAGQWDPFNVTEDADLGLRLARLGKRVDVLSSTTWEEAPPTRRAWLGQRTRWLKGWMQTYLVHMRRPERLLRDLGPWRFAGFQVMMGGMVLSALVHPWCIAVVAARGWAGSLFAIPDGGASDPLLGLSVFNLAASYASAMALAVVAAGRRGHRSAALSAAFIPLYWLAISVAAYRAVFELFHAPHHWEKTPHSAREAGEGERAGG